MNNPLISSLPFIAIVVAAVSLIAALVLRVNRKEEPKPAPEKKSGSKVANTFVGYIVLFLIFSLFMGPSRALGMLLVLVICTGGLGILLILAAAPIAYGLGTFAMWLIIYKWRKADEHVGGQEKQSTNEEIAVRNYIQQGRAGGLTDKEIVAKLQSAGWSENAITTAFGYESLR